MASMRDKLKGLKGKKVLFRDGSSIVAPFNETFHHEIVEVGDDYFVIKGSDGKEYTTYAISEVKSIAGGL